MSEVTNDESRLRATEAQMRRALGLQDSLSPRPEPTHSPTLPVASHRPPRHFVRDGEVPVTVIHRDHHPDGQAGTNQLEAARQTIRSLTAAREHADRLLAEAQATIRDLQTKLAHEHLAKDEAVQRAASERQTAEQAFQSARAELMTERAARQHAEAALAEALGGCQKGVARHTVTIAKSDQEAFQARRRGRPRKNSQQGERTASTVLAAVDANPEATDKVFVTVRESSGRPAGMDQPKVAEVQQPVRLRRRGRSPKMEDAEGEIVEWWVPGWKEQLRK